MKIKCRKYNLLLDSDLLNGFPDAGDGVQHKTRQSYEDAHENESFIVGAEGIVHVTCVSKIRKYFEHFEKKYFTNCWWPGQCGDTLEEEEETERVCEVLGSKEISEDQRRQQDIGSTEGKYIIKKPKVNKVGGALYNAERRLTL